MRGFLIDALTFLGILLLVTVVWQVIEIIAFGAIKPNGIDTIIGIILSLSLYGNLRHWFNSKA